MRATVEGDLRSTVQRKSKAGEMYFTHYVETKGRDGGLAMVEIYAKKNERKPGVQKFEVDIGLNTFNDVTKIQISEATK